MFSSTTIASSDYDATESVNPSIDWAVQVTPK